MNRLVATACLAAIACGAPARSPELPTASIPEVQTGVEQRPLPAIRVRGEDMDFTLADLRHGVQRRIECAARVA